MALSLKDIPRLIRVVSKDIVQTAIEKNIPAHVYGEVPSGVLDGLNSVFSIENIPIDNSLRVTINGIRDNNFIISGKNINFLTSPDSSDTILVDYDY